MTWDITVGRTVAVVGHNPESADVGNPTGAITGEVYLVVATRVGCDFEYSHFKSFRSLAEAHRLADRVREADRKGGWSPEASDHWSRRKIYGSPSWGDHDEAGLMDDEEREHRNRG